MATQVEGSTRRAELLGLVAFALALMLLISLATFDPRDPAPFFKAGEVQADAELHRPLRRLHRRAAHPAALRPRGPARCPSVLGLFGWKLFWCRPIDAPYTKATGLLLLLLLPHRLPDAQLPVPPVRRRERPRRRLDRRALSGFLVAEFSRTGAFIVVSTSLFVALILSTQFSFATALDARRTALGDRLRALQTAWAH